VQFAVEVTVDQGERIKHRPVILVVGAECQSAEHDRKHAAVMRAVGAADHRLEVVAVYWSSGFALGDEVAQGLLIAMPSGHQHPRHPVRPTWSSALCFSVPVKV
jgi:hypothetical protein